jgi:Holliday junction resolvase-like predicted endonuclease
MTTLPSTKARGDAAEVRALAYLVARGLVLVERNYRVARGPRARGGEVDLIARDTDGTLVFVEVRARRDGRGGQRRQRQAAAARLRRAPLSAPVCRAAAVPLRRRQPRRGSHRMVSRRLRRRMKGETGEAAIPREPTREMRVI